MNNVMECPKCGSDAEISGSVSCWCDKDFCSGQRCGADSLFAEFKCSNTDCGHTGVPHRTQVYKERNLDK